MKFEFLIKYNELYSFVCDLSPPPEIFITFRLNNYITGKIIIGMWVGVEAGVGEVGRKEKREKEREKKERMKRRIKKEKREKREKRRRK